MCGPQSPSSRCCPGSPWSATTVDQSSPAAPSPCRPSPAPGSAGPWRWPSAPVAAGLRHLRLVRPALARRRLLPVAAGALVGLVAGTSIPVSLWLPAAAARRQPGRAVPGGRLLLPAGVRRPPGRAVHAGDPVRDPDRCRHLHLRPGPHPDRAAGPDPRWNRCALRLLAVHRLPDRRARALRGRRAPRRHRILDLAAPAAPRARAPPGHSPAGSPAPADRGRAGLSWSSSPDPHAGLEPGDYPRAAADQVSASSDRALPAPGQDRAIPDCTGDPTTASMGRADASSPSPARSSGGLSGCSASDNARRPVGGLHPHADGTCLRTGPRISAAVG